MLRRIFVNASSKKNYLILNGRCNSISFNNFKLDVSGSQRLSAASSFQINFAQARFCSSNSTENVSHKVLFVNAESPESPTTADSAFDEGVQYIPPPPLPPEITEESLNVLNHLGEPTFQSLGLGGWWPIGLIQSGIEFLHVSCGLPWWGSIAAATVLMRMLLFPLVISSQRNTAKMSNHMPTIQHLQAKMSDARLNSNSLESARLAYELQTYMNKHEIKPMRNMLVPLAQSPIFISMFIGLRRCANLPVESMKDGGMFWFHDLTMADPFFALPVITSLTMLVTIEVGAEGQKVNQHSKLIRYVLRSLPFVIFPFTLQFPAAILCYWVSSNFCSLLQVGILKVPVVRTYFNIDSVMKHESTPAMAKAKNKGIVEGLKESWSNMKIASEVEERQRVDEMRFKKSGMEPLVKTYKHNPLKNQSNVIDVKAKFKK